MMRNRYFAAIQKVKRWICPGFTITVELLNSGQEASSGRKYSYWVVILGLVFPLVFFVGSILFPLAFKFAELVQPTLAAWGITDLLKLVNPRGRRSGLSLIVHLAGSIALVGILYPCFVVSLRVARQLVLGKHATLIVEDLYYPEKKCKADEKP